MKGSFLPQRQIFYQIIIKIPQSVFELSYNVWTDRQTRYTIICPSKDGRIKRHWKFILNEKAFHNLIWPVTSFFKISEVLNQIFSNFNTMLWTIKYRSNLIMVYIVFTVRSYGPFFLKESTQVHSRFMVASMLLMFLVFCVVFLWLLFLCVSVSCVPNNASVSRLSILNCPFGFR